MNPNALKIGIVSEDPQLIKDAFWGLKNFSYEVISVNDFQPFFEAWELSPVDLLLVDVDHPELARISELPALGKYGFTYKILLYDADRPTANLRGLGSAFNDAIVKPLNGGEMLSRIRAGARFVEFERRHRAQSMCDRATGLMSQRGLLKIAGEIEQSLGDREPQDFTMVVMRLDYLDTFSASHGVKNRDKLLCEVASLVTKTAGEEEFVARLRHDTLALVIPDSSLEEGNAVAALLHDNLEQTVFDIGGIPLQPTATFCVAAWESAARQFQEVLTAAERTLDHARLLGGGAIVHCGQFDQDFSTWQDNNWAGVDLSQLTARDVMVPFTLPWDASKSPAVIAMAARHSGVAYIPYLGEGGLYLGVLSREVLTRQALIGSSSESLDELSESSIVELLETPTTVCEDLPYAELMDHFTADDQDMVVVLRNERPLGYVTHAALATLLESVDRETFGHGGPVASGTGFLRVSDLATVTV